MKSRLLHTPEGVRDIYTEECDNKRFLQKKLHHILKQYGYCDIETPTFEFFDVFSREIGTIPSRELYKFFDREGNTLVLRPDFTPSIARCAAKYFSDNASTLRLCYSGSTFINTHEYQGRLKESTELGVECIGENSIELDGEIIATIVELLKEAGLKEFQIEIGEVDFFKGLLEETGVSEETAMTLRELISNKSFFEVEELLADLPMKEELKTIFLRLPQLFGPIERIMELKKLTNNKTSIHAIERLEALYKVLQTYGVEDYVTFDLGMLSKYNYYTGIIFRAYTHGSGEALIKGGRYDNLMEQFGTPRPSIGFVVDIDRLLTTLERQGISFPPAKKPVLILYTDKTFKDAAAKASGLRSAGAYVNMTKSVKTKEEYEAMLDKDSFEEILYMD